MTVKEVVGLKVVFKLVDTNNKGKINIDELQARLHKLGHQVSESDVQILMYEQDHLTTLILYYTSA